MNEIRFSRSARNHGAPGVRCIMFAMLLVLNANALYPGDRVSAKESGAYFSGVYPNHFVDLVGATPREVSTRLDSAFQKLFYGNDTTERIYFPVGSDMAYMLDVANNDVRT